jgi:hypothetical protein
MNIQDYFNSLAVYEKYRIKYIKNIDIPNEQIRNSSKQIESCKYDLASSRGALYAIDSIAKDLAQAYGITPPSLYEELQYAIDFIDMLQHERKYELGFALDKITWDAGKWDTNAMYRLNSLLEDKYISIADDFISIANHYGKNGIFPVYADLNDFPNKYIRRWQTIKPIDDLSKLPLFGEKDIINIGVPIPFDYGTLVLKQEALGGNGNKYNTLWMSCVDENTQSSDRNALMPLIAENLITGETAQWLYSDFYGLLKPEYVNNIDFTALQKQHQQIVLEQVQENDDDMEFELGD